MKILCLGGAGKICRESIYDLIQTSDFEQITIADPNQTEARIVVEWLDDSRVDFIRIDVSDSEKATDIMSGYDVVMDGTPISVNRKSTACIAKAGVHGINLNGMSKEWEFDAQFKENAKTCVPGFGMTPGITNMMAKYAANKLETVEEIYISHGAFRPIAFSPAIAETTVVEYDPHLDSRLVYEDGEFVQVPPFARPKMIDLPEPYGAHLQYIIPHPETETLAKSMVDKGVRRIEVRGTWPPPNMQLLRVLYDWGFLRNDQVEVSGTQIGIMDVIAQYLIQSKEGKTTKLYGYALHVEIIGKQEGKKVQHILTHTHPPADGSVKGWENLRAYTRCVGIPLSIGAQLIAKGRAETTGAVFPEFAFDPQEIFKELEKRKIFVHHSVSSL
ncbi:TPA: saccharopine dehydrogenase [Candidatus Poribacteria bacterium]|nr:saccharopine dehydrogenase [Candidatus Poribacteria bacterium]